MINIADVGFITSAIIVAGYLIKVNHRQKTHSKILCAICKKLNIDLRLANIDCEENE